MKELNDIIDDHLKRVSDAIEQACERALAGGLYGVLVMRYLDSPTVVDVSVDPSVPYGCIHERAAMSKADASSG